MKPVVLILIFAAVWLCAFSGLSPASPPLPPGRSGIGWAIPLPSTWRGVAEGTINGQQFRLPVTVGIRSPFREETNPVHISIAVGRSEMGSANLFSSNQTYTPSGRRVTLQYCQVQVGENGFDAQMTNTYQSAAAVGNFFTAPDISSQTAPAGPAQQLYQRLGQQMGGLEVFYFLEGTQCNARVNGGRMEGILQGDGRSVSGIFSTGRVTYTVRFAATLQ